MKILIIEDEIDLVKAIKKGFSKREYIIDYALDGKEGLELYYINDYDLIILDLNLPSMDGLEILRNIRQSDNSQRILILSARSSVEDKVKGLDLGANDYLVKPFSLLELDARVRSLLRSEKIQYSFKVSYKNMELDTLLKAVYINNIKVNLSPREYAIVEYLILNKGKVISAEDLLEHIWLDDINLFTDSVKVHISNIRKKFKEFSDEKYIYTIRGGGYLMHEEEE